MQECELFRFRLELQSKAGIAEFLRLNDIHYTPVSAEERAELAPMLARAGFRLNAEDVKNEQYFQVRPPATRHRALLHAAALPQDRPHALWPPLFLCAGPL